MKAVDALLDPRAIAIVGATADPARIGGQPHRILRASGYRGAVFPVNPNYDEIDGLRCYRDLASLPERCDLALVAVAAARVPDVIRACGAAGIPYAIVFSAGFREAGAQGAELEQALTRAARESGVRVIGPNCIGMMNLVERVYCGFGAGFNNPGLACGPLAFVSQSGGFAFSVVALAEHEGIGFNYVISGGNEADVTSLELLEAFLEREDVEIAVAYIEGVADGRRLRRIGARALALGKPVLVWKAGRTGSGHAAAQSHTASMTADDALYRAAFKEGGFIEIDDVHDLVDCARAFLGRRLPRGPNVGVITTSGGSGVLIADGCEARGLTLPRIARTTAESIASYAPPYSTLTNPVDLTAQITGDHARFNRAVADVLADAAIDQLVIRYGAVQGAKAESWADELAAIVEAQAKPVLVAWSRVPDRAEPALRKLEERRIPWLLTPARAARAAAALYEFSAKRQVYDTREARRSTTRPPVRTIEWPTGAATLSERESKRIMATYGIATTRDVALTLDDVERLEAPPLPFPLAVKVDSVDIGHKTEARAVRIGVDSLAGLKRAAREVVENARAWKPDARISGVLVCEIAAGVETIAGGLNDPYFGPVVMFGLGGVFAEVLRDVAYRYAPFDAETAHEMIAEVRGARLLDGYRGAPAVDTHALADTLSKLSSFMSDHQDRVASVDLNPVFASERAAVAADALIVLRPAKTANQPL